MNVSLLDRLSGLQEDLIQVVYSTNRRTSRVGDEEEYFRSQKHPCISPPGWHLGHCAYIECLWIREILTGDNCIDQDLRNFYTPELSAKGDRGFLLPPCNQLIEWARALMRENCERMSDPSFRIKKNKLLENDYITHFLINHHAQHLEILSMANAAWYSSLDMTKYKVKTPLTPSESDLVFISVDPGAAKIGGDTTFLYDNETPPHQVDLTNFRISLRPVTNGHYLAFMLDRGYLDPRWWSAAGWRWRSTSDIQKPNRWRQDGNKYWFEITLNGPSDLLKDSPICGVTRYEAAAFAAWAHARLPHEFEWEIAAKLGLLEKTGEVWEWCANTFHPFPGFGVYPYPEYSVPWFDQRHFLLKGGSSYTEEEIKRPTFRNYYVADADYLFSGIRLAN